jgi:hypothetical protein
MAVIPKLIWVLRKLHQLVNWYKAYCLGKAKVQQAEEVGLQAHMSRAQEHLQLNSVDPTAQQELASALDSFRSFDAYKLEGQQIQAEVK